jgi:hypothetical protein
MTTPNPPAVEVVARALWKHDCDEAGYLSLGYRFEDCEKPEKYRERSLAAIRAIRESGVMVDREEYEEAEEEAANQMRWKQQEHVRANEAERRLAEALTLLAQARERIAKDTTPKVYESWGGSITDRIDSLIKTNTTTPKDTGHDQHA